MRKKMKNGNLFSWCWFSSLRTVHKARLNHHFLVSTLGLPWPLHSWTPDPSCCCCSLVVKSCLSFATPWAIACQALLSMGLPRQKYWGGLPFPSLGDRDRTCVSCIGRQVLYHWAIRDAPRHDSSFKISTHRMPSFWFHCHLWRHRLNDSF